MSTAAASMPDFMGCTIDKHYKLTEVLGSGSFGVVYKAVDTRESPDSPTRTRAVKIIRKAGRSPQELGVIRREVALHSLVSAHPNIITIHDAFDDEEYFYIFLDYCPGGDLFYHIEEEAYMNDEELLRGAFVSLIDAVQHCHEHKIAHRDLKPENILASEDGSRVFLADFGLATVKRMVDQHGSGTSIYMAPECHGRLYDYEPYDTHAADIWALGVILVNMLTGRNPWEKACMKDDFFLRFVTNPDYFRDTFTALSSGARDILRDIFALNPLRRTSLHELREAVLNLKTFFRSDSDSYAEPEPEPVETHAESSTTTARFAKPELSESFLDVPDVPPGLSLPNPRWGDDEDDESPLVTPEGTTSGKPAKNAVAGKVDWEIGSPEQRLMACHRFEKQMG